MDGASILTTHRDFYPPLRRELGAAGAPVVDIDWDWAASSRPDVQACVVWFYDCLRRPMQVWRLKRQLQRWDIPLLAWNRDAPHYLNRKAWRLDLLDRFRLLDIYASHTLIDTRRQFADALLYLPNAADTARYSVTGPREAMWKYLRESDNYAWDVGFFGGMDGRRYKEDQPRADFFAALGARLAERNISFRFQEAEGMSVAEQIDFIRKSRINLNFGARCEYGAPLASGLPERCYGIPAAGGFLLCDRRTHARDDFTPGEDWAEFVGVDDCVAQVEQWLADFPAARDLAERCHDTVMSRHTYTQRAQTLLNALAAWRTGTRGRLA